MKSIIVFCVLIAVIFGAIAYSLFPDLFQGSEDYCSPIEISPDGNVVVLRIDDVQAFSWRDISIKMIDDALDRKMPASLAVIPIRLEEDQIIVDYLKKNHCNIEIALHGWANQVNGNHSIPEFGELSEEEALEKIDKGKAVLERISNEPIITFIPPLNVYSEGTATALQKTGFKIISSKGNNYFDYTTFSYDFGEKQLIPVPQVIAECKDGFNEKNLCIVMLHPQDYATGGKLDEEKYNQYLLLLSELKKETTSFARFKDLQNQ